MSNRPAKRPDAQRLQRRLADTVCSLLAALEASIDSDTHVALRNEAREVLRNIQPLGEP